MEINLAYVSSRIVLDEDGRALLELTTGGHHEESRTFVCDLRELVPVSEKEHKDA